MQLFISNRLTVSRRQSTRLIRSFPTITPWRLGQIVRRDEGEHYEIGRVSKVISRNEYHVIWNDRTIEKYLSFDEISDKDNSNHDAIDEKEQEQVNLEQEQLEPVEQEGLVEVKEVVLLVQEDGLAEEDNSDIALVLRR